MAKPLREQIATRFLKVIDDILGTITAKELCQKISFSEGTLSEMRAGKIVSIKAEYIVEVCLKYQYSVLWVMTGKGDMKADNQTRSIQEEISHIKQILGDIITPLLNEILKVEATYKPGKKKPFESSAVADLLKGLPKKSN
jgi:hypothetical protein